MKRFKNRRTGIFLLILLAVIFNGHKIIAQDVNVSYQDFYDDLSPYGQWVTDPQYGNVWIPNEGDDFRPYCSNGNWAMTDDGNTWVSNDPWGWICYHYGRWTYDDYYGWIWIPGYDWAPSWVSWRYGDGYCGWSPLGPDAGIGDDYNCPDNWWTFVGTQNMYQPNLYHYWRGHHNNPRYIRHTKAMNNSFVDNNTRVHYNFGPKADVIQRDTHKQVQVYHISQTEKPGLPAISGSNLNLYRPSVNMATVKNAHPANAIPIPRRIRVPLPATAANTSHQHTSGQQGQRQSLGNGSGIFGNGLRTNRQPLSQNRQRQNPVQYQNRPQRQNWSTPQQSRPQWQSQAMPQQYRPQTMPQQNWPQWQNRSAPQQSMPQQSFQLYREPQMSEAPRAAPQPAIRGGFGGRR